jgi:hypothetical protein
MSDIRGRVKKAEALLEGQGRDTVIVIRPPKYVEETDEAYSDRISSSQGLPRDIIKYGKITLQTPARPGPERSERRANELQA